MLRKYFRMVKKISIATVKNLHLGIVWRLIAMPFRIVWKVYTMGCTGFFIILFCISILLTAFGNVQDHFSSVFFRSYNAEKFHLEKMNVIASNILESAEKRNYEQICQHYTPDNRMANCSKQWEEILESRQYAFRQHRSLNLDAYEFTEDMESAYTAYFARYLSDEPGSNPFAGIEMEIFFVWENKNWQVSDLAWILHEEEDMPEVPNVWGVGTQL